MNTSVLVMPGAVSVAVIVAAIAKNNLISAAFELNVVRWTVEKANPAGIAKDRVSLYIHHTNMVLYIVYSKLLYVL